MAVDRLLKSTPDGKLTVIKSGLFGGQNVLHSELKVLTPSLCVSGGVRGNTALLALITGCAVAQHCCNDDRQSQWENGNFNPL